jgi:hypothetical protein
VPEGYKDRTLWLRLTLLDILGRLDFLWQTRQDSKELREGMSGVGRNSLVRQGLGDCQKTTPDSSLAEFVEGAQKFEPRRTGNDLVVKVLND